MGKKAQAQALAEDKPQGKGRAAAKAAAAPGFKMPEPDRVVQVSAPALLPPPLEEEEGNENEMETEDYTSCEAYGQDMLPKKLAMGHILLMKHPVVINAIDGFMTDQECRAWIQWGEKKGFEEAKQKQNTTYAFRDNGRIEFDSPEIAYLIWLRMKAFVPEEVGKAKRKVCGCSPRIRVYRYSKGQRFGQHVDGSRDEPTLGGRTHFTVLVYLNGGEKEDPEFHVRGGETVFWKDHDGRRPALAFPPTKGVCLFHGHGDECMTHEGAGVEEGAKYVLRTDVVYELEKEDEEILPARFQFPLLSIPSIPMHATWPEPTNFLA
eukprot:CAMPEP_0206466482 /NCGR_PEP_ID=MMETSP0324_2-20121206/28481_1 /ASSEMBLY_ACC=CAM_ASM_000836 /TAXON_ID=2866 /ORGANISM="Crypthecodinium cohnii, Strain Seligo" /LENGTH=320 /DNA_ID=CAMNT_0053939599 /DNA_START=116 /DNA_END=1079 /DNA_ORIENTATION=-